MIEPIPQPDAGTWRQGDEVVCVQMSRTYRFLKRAMDVVVALIGLALLSPLMILIALAIRCESPGSPLFRQVRVGKGGKPFIFLKFRTMYSNAEQMQDSLWACNEVEGPVFKMRHDPRVTPLGRFLRRYSLDELPQLWNVLCGQMSLVGPRPPLPAEVVCYTPRERLRLSVQPGLTCLWQVCGRSDIGFRDWVELDLAYIRTMSLMTDLHILWFTIPAVLSGKGAW